MCKFDLICQVDALWGVACLSTGPEPLLLNSDQLDNFDFVFDNSAGKGTNVYVLDTGTRTTRDDFGGRADLLKSFICSKDSSTNLNGHTSFLCQLLFNANQLINGSPPRWYPLHWFHRWRTLWCRQACPPPWHQSP